MLAFLFVFFSAILLEINIYLYILYGDIYRTGINEIYHAFKPTVAVLLLLASAPSSVLARLLTPIRYLLMRRQQKQQLCMQYLHQKLTQIVPSICLPLDQVRDVRILIEIGDAREVIWSHYLHSKPITAKEEAELLFSLLQQRVIMTRPGQYQPPAIQDNLINHNVTVAQYLRKLEQGQQ